VEVTGVAKEWETKADLSFEQLIGGFENKHLQLITSFPSQSLMSGVRCGKALALNINSDGSGRINGVYEQTVRMKGGKTEKDIC
jgi:hypothetical protein